MAKIRYGVEITMSDEDLRDYLDSMGDFTKEDLRKALLFSVSSQCGADIAKYSNKDMQIKPFAEVEEDEELGIMIC